MEKRNTILLTVIAIATLLVAVVGATFAYFTASLTQNTNNGNGTDAVKATTATMTNVDFTYGSNITPNRTIYPGYTTVNAFHVESYGGDTATTIVLTITPDVTKFDEGNIKYTLYKGNNTVTVSDGGERQASSTYTGTTVQCATEPKSTTTTNVQWNEVALSTNNNVVCPNLSELVSGSESNGFETVIAETAFVGTTKVEKEITLTGNTDAWYYLVVEYVDVKTGTGNPVSEQGQTFTVDISAKLK